MRSGSFWNVIHIELLKSTNSRETGKIVEYLYIELVERLLKKWVYEQIFSLAVWKDTLDLLDSGFPGPGGQDIERRHS